MSDQVVESFREPEHEFAAGSNASTWAGGESCSSIWSRNINKDKLADRFIPLRGEEETQTFYDLSCSLTKPEHKSLETKKAGSVAPYSLMLVKGIFNYKLDFKKCRPTPEGLSRQTDKTASHARAAPSNSNEQLSTLLSGPASEVFSGLSFSGAFSKQGVPGISSPSLVLSRVSEPNGFSKVLKYKNPVSLTGQKKEPGFDDTIDLSPFGSSEEKEVSFGLNNNSQEFKTTFKESLPSKPIKILEAPNLREDFYCNLLDWGKKNIMSVALGRTIYLWNATNNSVTKMPEIHQPSYYTSVKWSPSGNLLSLGTDSGVLELWDTTKSLSLNAFKFHLGRIGSIEWGGENWFMSGSRDRSIVIYDTRTPQPVSRMKGHKQEVCGLRWSSDCELLASGGNDYKINIWSIKKESPVCKLRHHKSAVKALDWNPRQRGVLVSGGGNNDKTIKAYSTFSGRVIKEVNAGNQVCNLRFSKHSNEFVSTHGFTNNDIGVWDYNSMEQVASLEGHHTRVLYMCMSPDHENIATAAGDEVIKFWSVFPRPKKEQSEVVSVESLQLR